MFTTSANAEAQRRLRENKKQTGGQFKCSLCEPEEAFERREALMRHMKDHYKHDKPKSKDNEAFRYFLKHMNNLVHKYNHLLFCLQEKVCFRKATRKSRCL